MAVKLREPTTLSNSCLVHSRFPRNNFYDSCNLKTFPAERRASNTTLSKVIPRNSKVVEGLTISFLSKEGLPNRKHIKHANLYLSNLGSADKKSSNKWGRCGTSYLLIIYSTISGKALKVPELDLQPVGNPSAM